LTIGKKEGIVVESIYRSIPNVNVVYICEKSTRRIRMNKKHLGTFPQVFITITFASVFSFVSSVTWAGVVTNTNDTGPGSLRQEIISANGDVMATAITFDPNVFPATINLATRLPALTDPGDSVDGAGLGVVLDGFGVSDSPSVPGVGIRIKASNITITGLIIKNFPNDGIRVEPLVVAGSTVTGVLISNNSVQDNLDGLRVSGGVGPGNSVEATIQSNNFSFNNDDSIFVIGSSGNHGDGNNDVQVTITDNTMTGSHGSQTGGQRTGDGIRVLGGAGFGSDNTLNATIAQNRIFNNADDGIVIAGAGVDAASRNQISVTILDNIVARNGGSTSLGGDGILVRAGNRGGGSGATGNTINASITSNTCEDSSRDGIRVTGGRGTSNNISSVNILDNVARRNGQDGIGVTGGGGTVNLLTGINITGNRISDNERHGTRVSPGSGGGNTVFLMGIILNRAERNVADGIVVGALVSGAATPISGNRANANGQDGIDIDATGYVLTNNRADRNGSDGINAVSNINDGGNIARRNAACNTPGCF
jgi:hypothetical protein